MPQNPIQFQQGMSLTEFTQNYGTEARCETALLRSRWPEGFVCPDCGGRAHSTFTLDGRRYWQCSHCRSQHTLCLGTLFHASKRPLTTWFQALDLVTQNKSCLSALSLKRHLRCHYRHPARIQRPGALPFDGLPIYVGIEAVDETVVVPAGTFYGCLKFRFDQAGLEFSLGGMGSVGLFFLKDGGLQRATLRRGGAGTIPNAWSMIRRAGRALPE